LTTLLALATAVCALLAAAAEALHLPWLAFVFKPLATLLVIVHAARRGEGAGRRWLLIGLALSWLGDVALLWPEQGFVPGLLAFLLTHVSYTVAFTRDARFAAKPVAFVAYAAVAGTVLLVLWPGVPVALRGPVIVYVAALSTMAAQAAARWLASPSDALRRRAAIGAALFVVSDALLALDRFHAALPFAALCVLVPYWLAQWLIASSLPRRS
jgi:uncharacterized membrane protein YhhN